MVALIIASGGANLIGTAQKGNELGYEQREAIRQVRELHQSLEDFEERQRDALKVVHQILENQNRVMENDTVLIKQTHEIAERLNRLKNLEQTRGSPP